ncbi:hypothetical protein [Kitasatospora sp. NBC_01539]|uniref:hypothetical protein n=1 Tax=Kitasatospora sp. NBC_01539 TaxID=2903577 RepID=UPI0038601728
MAVGLLAVGCSSAGGGSGLDETFTAGSAGASPKAAGSAGAAGKALPVAIDGPQKDVVMRGGDALKVLPAPESDTPFAEKLKHSLRETLLSRAHVPGETSADCPNGVTQKAGAVSQCTVTYEGAQVPYEVKISDSYKPGSFIISYTRTPKKGLLVAKMVYNLLWESYGADSGRTDTSRLACDEIPVAKTVDFDSDTGYTCQYWSEHADDGEPGYATLKVTMGSSGSPGFKTVR